MRVEHYVDVDASHGAPHDHNGDQLVAVLEGAIELKIFDGPTERKGNPFEQRKHYPVALGGAVRLPFGANAVIPERTGHTVMVSAGEWIVIPAGTPHSGRTSKVPARVIFMEETGSFQGQGIVN